MAQLREEIAQKEKQAATIRKALDDAKDTPEDKALTDQLAELQREIAGKWETVGKRSVLEQARGRISELQQEARNAAEKLEAIESMLYIVDEFPV